MQGKLTQFEPSIAGAKGEPGLSVAEKGLPGPRGQDGEPGLSGSPGKTIVIIPLLSCSCSCVCLLSDYFAMGCYQVTQVNLGSLVSLVYQDPRVNQDSQALDSPEPQDLKVEPLSHFLHELHLSSLLVFLFHLHLCPFPPHRIPWNPWTTWSSCRSRQTRSRWAPWSTWITWI